jgi:hypothetical protein
MTDISELELDLLTLCYVNSNDHGQVDMATVSQIAKQKMGVFLPVVPMKLTQKHLDVLTSHGIFPEIKTEIMKIANNESRTKPKFKRKAGPKKTSE